VRFDCSGVGSYQNEVRGGSERFLDTLALCFIVECLEHAAD